MVILLLNAVKRRRHTPYYMC